MTTVDPLHVWKHDEKENTAAESCFLLDSTQLCLLGVGGAQRKEIRLLN